MGSTQVITLALRAVRGVAGAFALVAVFGVLAAALGEHKLGFTVEGQLTVLFVATVVFLICGALSRELQRRSVTGRATDAQRPNVY